MEIVFVCTGNTCRSPLAESIAKSLTSAHQFSSRGIYASIGTEASLHTQQIIEKYALPAPTLSAPFTKDDSTKDLILTMTQSHRDTILSMYPKSNVYTLREYTEGAAKDIIDPYGGDYEIYHTTYVTLKENITKLLTKIDENKTN
ncbi:low molecular weight protein arginine phosphatase [Macrococcoides caseolyticum]|uniref:low molecular weight protein arginine phosphatase n=1 Tax=Macrococcoides caseolyticum TaxID=69966 RepID=UPI001F1CE6DF|nr:low molecular weight protein arginine phosphatase [Macrococcus caseolyticus]MCE4957585.1 low molecular weight protein arginine phosphatase [Macrococcus caseolyticus]